MKPDFPEEALTHLHNFWYIHSPEAVTERINRELGLQLSVRRVCRAAVEAGLSIRDAHGNVLMTDAARLLDTTPETLKKRMKEVGMKLVGGRHYRWVKLEDFEKLKPIFAKPHLSVDLVSVKEAARVAGYSVSGIHKLYLRGGIRGERHGKRLFISRSDAFKLRTTVPEKAVPLKDAALLLAYSTATVQRLIQDGRLKAFKRGTHYQVPVAEIERYKKESGDYEAHGEGGDRLVVAAAPRGRVGLLPRAEHQYRVQPAAHRRLRDALVAV